MKEIVQYLKEKFISVDIYIGKIGDKFPLYKDKNYDIILSYLSPWIVPEHYINSAKIALNFHPGPPEYPGIGCFNFALYDGIDTYGVTCHHMKAKVDSGAIVDVKRFSVIKDETVLSLSLKSYSYMQSLFFEVVDILSSGTRLHESPEKWSRSPYTRKDLEQLCIIKKDQPIEEILRRVKATTYPGMPGSYFIHEGEGYTVSRTPERDQCRDLYENS